MPVARGFDGSWIISGRMSELFAPILRAHFDRQLQVDKAPVHPAILRELDEGEAAAALSREERSGRNPDSSDSQKGSFVTFGDVRHEKVIRGLRRASAIAGVPPSTLADRVKRGEIPAERQGNALVFRIEHLRSTGAGNG